MSTPRASSTTSIETDETGSRLERFSAVTRTSLPLVDRAVIVPLTPRTEISLPRATDPFHEKSCWALALVAVVRVIAARAMGVIAALLIVLGVIIRPPFANARDF